MFCPSLPVTDFHEIAKNHGLVMDESVRDWTNTNFSTGLADSAVLRRDLPSGAGKKRIGGLPLFIMFDMATKQDSTYNVLWGLAAGSGTRTPPRSASSSAGSLARFLTRCSAFIWDGLPPAFKDVRPRSFKSTAPPPEMPRPAAGSTPGARARSGGALVRPIRLAPQAPQWTSGTAGQHRQPAAISRVLSNSVMPGGRCGTWA